MREAQAESSFPLRSSKKNFRKKLLKTFGSLKITPYLCTRFWEENLEAELRKKLRKKFRKNLEDIRKTPYLCNRFPIKRRASRRAIFEEIYINNTVVQEQNWKQFWVKKRTVNTYIYIGNELLIRNPDRATTYLDIIWYSGVKDTFTMKSLILAQDER